MNKLFLIVLVGVGALVGFRLWGGGGHPAVFADVRLSDALDRQSGAGEVLLVKATASWCPPCKQMDRDTFSDSRVAEWFGSRGEGAMAIALDVDKYRADAQALGVRSMPTVILFVGGEEAARFSGYRDPKELLSWLEQNAPARLSGAK